MRTVRIFYYLCTMEKDNRYIGVISSSIERNENDFYATSPKAVELLLQKEKFYKKVLEPCCGEGHISKVLLRRGYEVISSDLYDYGFGDYGVDFLDRDNTYINSLRGKVDIITNFPYRQTLPMLQRAFEVARNKICALYPLTYLPRFYYIPPTKVYIFTRRITIAKGGDFDRYRGGNIKEFAWFIWYKGVKRVTEVCYINNNKYVPPSIVEYERFFEKQPLYEKKQQLIKLYYEDHLPKREIARILGISEGAVRKWLKKI